MPVSSALRCLKFLSLLTGAGGLVMLVLMAKAREIPEVKISGINPLMDYAVVCIEGAVERNPYINDAGEKGGCVSFVINDGSGELRVVAYRRVARELIENGAVPGKGSSIRVSGRISISGGGSPKLVLTSSAGIVFTQEG